MLILKKTGNFAKNLISTFILLALLASLFPPVGLASEPQRITWNSLEQNNPVVSDKAIAWQDYRNPLNDPNTDNNIDIWTYPFPSGPETNITGNVSQEHPAIYGNKVVYHSFYPTKGAYNFEIFVDDISDTAPAQQLTFGNYTQVYPDIFGDKIVYQDNRNPLSRYDIYLYDLSIDSDSDGTPNYLESPKPSPDPAEKRLTDNPSNQLSPKISGDKVVWVDLRDGNSEIYLYNLTTAEEKRITNNPSNQFSPDISGDTIVWGDSRNGESDIYMHNLKTGQESPVTTAPSSQSNPRIYGNKIVYEDKRNGNSDIYMKNLTTGLEVPIAAYPSDQLSPEINGNKVVWQDLRNDSGDIYLKELDSSSPSTPASLLATAMSPSRIEVSWSPSSDNEGVAGYKVERSTDGTNFQELGNANGPPYADTGLPSSTTYWYRVRAYDGYGNTSDYSNVASATTQTPPLSKSVERLWGMTSADTAIAISKKGWVDYSSGVAVVARDDYFTDALAGGPLAYAVRNLYGNPAPILLTGSHSRPDALVFEIMRLGVHKIYLLGGPGAVDEKVEASLRDIPGVTELKRLWGQTAYGTAQAIKEEMDVTSDLSARPRPDTAIIATGENFPDSLVISGPAASKNMPILLVKPFKNEPQPETKVALSGIKKTIIVGGPGAVHPDLEKWLGDNGYTVQTRLWGMTEYDTAIDVCSSGYDLFGMDRSAVFVTRGDYFTDALAGGPLAAWWGPAPMVLVRPDSIPMSTNLWLNGYRGNIYNVFILGGWGAISDGVKGQIDGMIL